MALASLQEIETKYLGVEFLSSAFYGPKILRNVVKNRERSSLLYVIDGEYLYTYDGGEFVAKAGSVVYLPRGGNYEYAILSDKKYVCQIEFQLFYKNEFFIFAEQPTIVVEKAGKEIGEIFADIATAQSNGISVAEHLKKNAAILTLLAACCDGDQRKEENAQYKKILPAVEYIKKNFNQKIHVTELENACYLSGSQIRRIFKQELHLTPIQYKNQLLLEVACQMLSYHHTVSEVSDFLGFDDVYVFSHFFKDRMGISPMRYIKQLKQTNL